MFGFTKSLFFKFLFEQFCNFSSPPRLQEMNENLCALEESFSLVSLSELKFFSSSLSSQEHSTVFRNDENFRDPHVECFKRWWLKNFFSDLHKLLSIMLVNSTLPLMLMLADVRIESFIWARTVMWMFYMRIWILSHTLNSTHCFIITIHYNEMLSGFLLTKTMEKIVDLRFTGAKWTFARNHIQSSSSHTLQIANRTKKQKTKKKFIHHQNKRSVGKLAEWKNFLQGCKHCWKLKKYKKINDANYDFMNMKILPSNTCRVCRVA